VGVFSLDAEHDLVFVPTEVRRRTILADSQGHDTVGEFVVALRASTGALVWGFQVVHHDLWDTT
jgi:quinoprotein glucose dehydrogenase